MRVAIVGGKLQGVEAAYLAEKAGWEVLLLDRRPDVPATGLCDRFLPFEVRSAAETAGVLAAADLVLPALENPDALKVLTACAQAGDIRLAFDLEAFLLTASKVRSNTLFEWLNIPAPDRWPGCGLPVIVKPDSASGSRGVRLILTPEELAPYETRQTEYVIEAFTPGPSYSLEVVGRPGGYHALQVTALEMDAGFDCKRVTAPTDLDTHLVRQFEDLAVRLAEGVSLKGVMDVEVVLDDGRLKVLEIDARLPSQTPTAVYWSTGINMVALLGRLFRGRELSPPPAADSRQRAVIYEHIHVAGTKLEVTGEHIMTGCGPLKVQRDFFGADEAITSRRRDRGEWVATLIFSDADIGTVTARRNTAIEAICRHFGLDPVVDPGPPVVNPWKGPS